MILTLAPNYFTACHYVAISFTDFTLHCCSIRMPKEMARDNIYKEEIFETVKLYTKDPSHASTAYTNVDDLSKLSSILFLLYATAAVFIYSVLDHINSVGDSHLEAIPGVYGGSGVNAHFLRSGR